MSSNVLVYPKTALQTVSSKLRPPFLTHSPPHMRRGRTLWSDIDHSCGSPQRSCSRAHSIHGNLNARTSAGSSRTRLSCIAMFPPAHTARRRCTGATTSLLSLQLTRSQPVDLSVHAGDLAAKVSDFFAVAKVLVQNLHRVATV
jgi:hypothetical protein